MKKIAVLLVGKYSIGSGMARTAVMLCDALLKSDPDIRVIFGTGLSAEQVHPLIHKDGRTRLEIHNLVWGTTIAADGTKWLRPQSFDGYDYMDADAWIFWHLPSDGVIAPLRPYAVFCADLLCRIVPAALSPKGLDDKVWKGLSNCLRSYRNANLIFCTTPRTAEDVVAYAGVPRARVCLAPQFAPTGTEDFAEEPSAAPFPTYFLWTSNDTPHKNHLRAFRMLDAYYSKYPDEALPFVLTGPGTHLMRPQPEPNSAYHQEIRNFLQEHSHILKNIHFAGIMDRRQFIGTMKHASFLWHNVIYDNGTAAVLEAAEHGIPSLATDYPQMRYFDEKYGTKARFFSAFDIEGGTQALIEMTRQTAAGTAGKVSIDYDEENAKFYDWVRRLVPHLTEQQANCVTCEAAHDTAFNESKAGVSLAVNAVKIWPELASFMNAFPWSDTPVVCLLVSERSKAGLKKLINAFEAALRQHYINFKLLVLLPDDQECFESFKAILSQQILAFDFLYAGSVTNAADLASAKTLAQITFCDSEASALITTDEADTRPRSTPITLNTAQPTEALTAIIVQKLGVPTLPAGDQITTPWLDSQNSAHRRKAVAVVVEPPIMRAPDPLNFSKERLKEYMEWLTPYLI